MGAGRRRRIAARMAEAAAADQGPVTADAAAATQDVLDLAVADAVAETGADEALVRAVAAHLARVTPAIASTLSGGRRPSAPGASSGRIIAVHSGVHGAVLDATRAVLLGNVASCLIAGGRLEPARGQVAVTAPGCHYALELAGRVNRGDENVAHLYLFDRAAAAALASHLFLLAERNGEFPQFMAELQAAVEAGSGTDDEGTTL